MNRTRFFITVGAAATLCAIVAAPARADDDAVPMNTVRVGLYAVMYHASATDISGPYTPPGLSLDQNSVDTIYLGLVRKLSTHFITELALGAPPLTSSTGKGPATVGSVPFNGQLIAKARWLAPTALIEYEFFDDASAFRPYIGVGINYTQFYDRRVTLAGAEASGGPTKLSMRSSVGPAGTLGISWHLTPNLEFNASYSVADVATSLALDTAGVTRHAHVQFLPTPFIFSVGYSFGR